MAGLEIRQAQRGELAACAAVLSRGMRDNPVHVAAFGDDPDVRRERLARVFGAMLPLVPRRPLVGLHDGTIVAVWGGARPGTCQPSSLQKLRLAPAVLACGLPTASKLLTWLGAWGARDPREPHWHLGPVGVDQHLQGRGVGSQMMGAWCELLDGHSAAGYLETDKPENVRFYAKFGFETIAEAQVLGTANWFMSRAARSQARAR